MAEQQNWITIYGPKTDGTYVVEFRTADGDAISIPRTETAVSPTAWWCRTFSTLRGNGPRTCLGDVVTPD